MEMELTIVKEGEWIVVIPVEQTRLECEAMVLGSEGDFVWLFCPDSLEIFRSNPACILQYETRKVLFDYDACKTLNEVFDEEGQCLSGVFWHASEALRQRMTNLLKTWKLILP